MIKTVGFPGKTWNYILEYVILNKLLFLIGGNGFDAG